MFIDATTPDLGAGPYGIERGDDDFYHVTLNGSRTGKSYPIGKTAYRTVRKLNEGYLDSLPEREPLDLTKLLKVKAAKPRKSKSLRKPASVPQPKAAPEPEREPLDLSAVIFQGTREEWLNAFVAAARPVFKQRGYELPEKIRVTVGFPHNHRGGKVIGQCWAEAASADGTREILVTPLLDDSSRIADVLTHELCHTLFGTEEKHGANFKRVAYALGLTGKPSATEAGDAWREWAEPILTGLGPIPHARLDPTKSGVKKQATRLLKCECDECGFTFRTAAKWVTGRELQCPDSKCRGWVVVTLPEGSEG